MLDDPRWLLWFLAQVEAAMRSSQSLVGALAQKAQFWVAHAQSDLNARQRKGVNRMLDAEPDGQRRAQATAQRDLSGLVEAGCLAAWAKDVVRYELRLQRGRR